MPSEGEAQRLLEERKRVHIPDEFKRVIPPKTKGENKEEKKEKRKRESSSSNAESATRRDA